MAIAGDHKGYYRALGVGRDASAEDIRSAFRHRAKRLHPDSVESSEGDGFQQLTEAYEVLRDPRRRLQYDSEGLASGNGKASRSAFGEPWRLSGLRRRSPQSPDDIANRAEREEQSRSALLMAVIVLSFALAIAGGALWRMSR